MKTILTACLVVAGCHRALDIGRDAAFVDLAVQDATTVADAALSVDLGACDPGKFGFTASDACQGDGLAFCIAPSSQSIIASIAPNATNQHVGRRPTRII